jgi:chromosome segregation protein
LDAPLDESNINRFVRVLQRFIEHSQFIIITHNKRTIGMADVLYGVTMQEHGVSKIVSVKFHKANEPVNVTTTTTSHEHDLVPPPPGPTVEEMEDAPHTREETLEVTPD